MRVSIAQLVVGRDVAENARKIRSVLRAAEPGDWVAFPEGALSGYFPEDESFLTQIDHREIEHHMREIGAEARRSACHCLYGSATSTDGVWHNSAIVQSSTGETFMYRKIGLSRLDVQHFAAGMDLPAFSIGCVTIGLQLCRELILPGPWTTLKSQGAQVMFHINNAIKPHDRIWEHVIVTRAVENGVFVCSVNNAEAPQELTSYLVDPAGRMLLKAARQTEEVITHDIDLRMVIAKLDAREDF